MKNLYLLVFIPFLILGCSPKTSSTIVAVDYSEKKDVTDYLVLPYGTIHFPGKWTKTNYNTSSRQQFMKNTDSITIAASITPCNKYEFNQENNLKGIEFIEAFYNWESNYRTEQGFTTSIIEKNENNSYLIWKLYGDSKYGYLDNIYLFGIKDCIVYNILVLSTTEWNQNEKIAFLKKAFE